MQICPICSQYQLDSTRRANGGLAVLAKHLENDHAQSLRGDNNARPWRCPFCPDGKRCYKESNGLAQHLLKIHVPNVAAATNQAAAGSETPPVRQSNPNPQPDNEQSEYGTLLNVPCLPWLPRPKCWTRPPSAAVILATWNLEHFSYDQTRRDTDEKVTQISKTLLELCSSDVCRNYRASMVVALQEVFSGEAVKRLVERLTEMDCGSGRLWHGVTSGPLGNNSERAAFVWSGPPTPSSGQSEERLAGCCGGARGRSEAPLHVDLRRNFQLLSKDDLATIQGEPQPAHFIRSPFFGLFRVGYANLVLVNVHIAAGKKEARSELSALNCLAEAITGPNGRLLNRHFLGGRLKGRTPRGMVSILGDFNCPLHVIKAPSITTDATNAASSSTSTIATITTDTATTADSAGPGPVAESKNPKTQQGVARDSGAGATGGVGGIGGNAEATNRSSWDAFLSNGWFNALCSENHQGATNSIREQSKRANGSRGGGNTVASSSTNGTPPSTNWRAKELKDFDAICLQQMHWGLVRDRGVCQPPSDMDSSQYPNHLLCWVLLDLEPLQHAPGKVRPLLRPVRKPGMPAAAAAVGGNAVAGEV